MDKMNLYSPKSLTLTSSEINLIDRINSFSFPILANYGSIGAINKVVPVALEDEKPDPIVKTLIYNKEEAEAKFQEAMDRNKQALNEGNKPLADYYERRMGVYSCIIAKCKGGILSERVSENWLGCYAKKSVTLYLGAIKGSPSKLAGTYVHEMMHAYFATQKAVREIEEPITEYATLKFLEAFDKDLFKDYYREVCNKKSDQIAQFYGFGAYLFDATTTDWLCLYKKRGGNLPTSVNKEHYLRLFSDQYPIDNEKDCAKMLERILKGVNKEVRISKNAYRGGAIEEMVNRGDLITPFAFDKKTNTLYINCDMDDIPYCHFFDRYFCRLSRHSSGVKTNNIKVILGPCAEGGDIRFAYEGVTVTDVTLSPKNTHYRIENDLLLSYNGKEVYCPLRTSGSFVIPEGVERIEDDAFEECKGITSVKLPNSLKSIGARAFWWSGLTSILLPDGLEKIESSAFKNTGIKYAYIPKSVEQMSDNSFDKNVTVVIDPANNKLAC